jgi:hypothetical protein
MPMFRAFTVHLARILDSFSHLTPMIIPTTGEMTSAGGTGQMDVKKGERRWHVR